MLVFKWDVTAQEVRGSGGGGLVEIKSRKARQAESENDEWAEGCNPDMRWQGPLQGKKEPRYFGTLEKVRGKDRRKLFLGQLARTESRV